jgi:hypothetical protein
MMRGMRPTNAPEDMRMPGKPVRLFNERAIGGMFAPPKPRPLHSHGLHRSLRQPAQPDATHLTRTLSQPMLHLACTSKKTALHLWSAVCCLSPRRCLDAINARI